MCTSGTELLIKAYHPWAGQSWALSWRSGAESQSWDRRAVGFACGSNEVQQLITFTHLHVGVHWRHEAQCLESIDREISLLPPWVRERT